jgi:outer membrane protein
MSISRNALLLFFLLICSAPLLAQTRKGAWLIGGDASFNIPFRSGGTFNWESNLNPRIGYFLGQNFAVGAAVPFGYSASITRKNASVHTWMNGETVSLKRQTALNYGLAPFVRGYFGSSKWQPFLHAQIGRNRYTFRTVLEDRPTIATGRSHTSAVAGVGLNYFVRDHIGLEAMLAYRYNTVEAYNIDNGSSVGITFGLQFYLFKR